MFKLAYTLPACLFVAIMPASAGIIPIAQPDSTYTTNTILLPIPGNAGDSVNSLTDGVFTINLSATETIADVSVNGWSTWGAPPDTESSTPRVLHDPGYNPAATSITLSFSDGVQTFGLEAEPDPFSVHNITLDFYNGATLLGSITRSIDGNSGARLLAGTSDGALITSAVLSSDTDFAFGQVRAAEVPEPATFALFGTGIGALLLAVRRRQRS